MSAAMLSVVLTRFDMTVGDFRGRAGLADEAAYLEWSRGRLPLFEAVCLPSLLGQESRPDAWLIGFDALAPERAAPVLERVSAHSWIRPVWQQTINGRPESVRSPFLREIRSLLSESHRYVVSTRVDNDDALSLDHCRRRDARCLQALEEQPGQEDFWLTFPAGLQLSPSGLRHFRYVTNPFLSRCERAHRFQDKRGGSALDGNHSRVLEQAAVVVAETDGPMWLQHVHGANVSNQERPGLTPVADVAATYASFGLPPCGPAQARAL